MMTKEQEAKLFALRENVNDENIRIKEIIKEELYNLFKVTGKAIDSYS